MAGVGNILIKVGAETASAVSGLGKVDRALGDTMSTSEKMGAGLRKAALPAAAALGILAVGAVDATKAALEDAAAQEKLAGQLERTTGATDAQVKASEAFISKLSLSTGVADDELRPALGKLASATGDITTAQKELGVALDVSAASGKSVEQVSNAMAKAHDGSVGALWKMVPGLKAATGASKDMTVTMEALAAMTGGAMADSANTSAGQMKVLANQSAELKETLGAALIPVVAALLPLLTKMGAFMAENTGLIKAAIAVVATFAGGILVANAAIKAYGIATQAWAAITKTATAVQWLYNAALTANPIGLVIAALVLLGAALIVAYKKSETFRDIVNGALNSVRGVLNQLVGVFNTLRDVAGSVYNFVASHWKVAMFAFGPLAVAITLIATNFGTIKAVAGDVASAVASAINSITSAINSVIGAIQSLINWIRNIPSPHINWPSIPSWIPHTALPSGAYSLSPAAAGYRSSRSSRASSPSSGVTVNVYGAVDPEQTARAIRRVLERSDRRNGRLVGA